MLFSGGKREMNSIHFEQGILLTVFFLLFAYCGFVKNPTRSSLPASYYLVWGILAILANSIALLIREAAGLSNYPILTLIQLKAVSIESSFIILGYCLLVRAAATTLRNVLSPAAFRTRRSLF